jgi:membrane protease YdiL (CAAX protease family)
MTSSEVRPVTTPTILGLIVVIGLVDIVTTRLVAPVVDPFVRVGVVAGLLLWARRAVGLSWDEIGCARNKIGSGLRWGALAALFVAVFVILTVAVPATREFFTNDEVASDSTATRWFEPLVSIPLATVLFEEVIFRGVLLGTLMRAATRTQAILVSAVVFGLWHIPPALSDAGGKGVLATFGIVFGTIMFTTVAGVIFAYLRLRSGSLLAPIMAHTASNSFAYVGAVVALDL